MIVAGRLASLFFGPVPGKRGHLVAAGLNSVGIQSAGGLGIVRVQNPIVLSDHSEPEPDFALLRPRDDFYVDEHPMASDVLLVIIATYPVSSGMKTSTCRSATLVSL